MSAARRLLHLIDRVRPSSADGLRVLRSAVPRPVRSVDDQSPLAPGAVDVEELCRTISVEELAESADVYFRDRTEAIDSWHAKPFWDISQAPDLLASFGMSLGALRLRQGLRVLDFGAGSGWTSRSMSQLGCEVVVTDVSEAALDIARELYRRYPVLGDRPEPTFLHFDARRFDLADASIDRVLCFDSFHHTSNPAEVIAEMGRVLRPGGSAVFSEPGPNHSRSTQSQYEMRNHRVVENDIKMRDIERWARSAGFDHVELATALPGPSFVSVDDYERLLAGRLPAWRFLAHSRGALLNRRLFVLHRAGREAQDSRERRGLRGSVAVDLGSTTVGPGGLISGTFVAENTGENDWLPMGSGAGTVRLGVHLLGAGGSMVDHEFGRIELGHTSPAGPGRRLEGTFTLPAPAPGSYILEFDLVAEDVAWFEFCGHTPRRLPVEVR